MKKNYLQGKISPSFNKIHNSLEIIIFFTVYCIKFHPKRIFRKILIFLHDFYKKWIRKQCSKGLWQPSTSRQNYFALGKKTDLKRYKKHKTKENNQPTFGTALFFFNYSNIEFYQAFKL